MSERKVLNKYYPPDYDPAKIPRLKRPKIRQFAIRVMAPFNMRCNTCGEYIYKGKKFNSRQETVENKDYLGLRIYRFYIKCPKCVSEITFLTDPENCDYSIEGGASRNFEAAKTAMKLAIEAQKEIDDEEANNPMKVLENRTKSSRQEMDMLETLQELKEINSSHARLDENQVIELHTRYKQQLELLQDQEDEKLVLLDMEIDNHCALQLIRNYLLEIFASKENNSVKRLTDDLDDDLTDLLNPDLNSKASKLSHIELPKNDAISKAFSKKSVSTPNVQRKSMLSNIVRKKETKTEPKSEKAILPEDYKFPPQLTNSIVPGIYSKIAPLKRAEVVTTSSPSTSAGFTGGLGLLADYSDSSDSASSNSPS